MNQFTLYDLAEAAGGKVTLYVPGTRTTAASFQYEVLDEWFIAHLPEFSEWTWEELWHLVGRLYLRGFAADGFRDDVSAVRLSWKGEQQEKSYDDAVGLNGNPSTRLGLLELNLVRAGEDLAPPMTELDLARFEGAHSVRLPNEYRKFVTVLSSGCRGGPPDSGLTPPGEDVELPSPNMYARLSQPFELRERYVLGNAQRFLQGLLVLGADGCGQFWLLVVTGPARGQIWSLSEEALQPWYGRGFYDWMEHWLRNGVDWWNAQREDATHS